MQSDRAVKSVFFYGLFMDADLLEAKGLDPVNPRLAHVKGYALRIGEMATLEPSTAACLQSGVSQSETMPADFRQWFYECENVIP